MDSVQAANGSGLVAEEKLIEKATMRRRLKGVVVADAAARSGVICDVLLGEILKLPEVRKIGLYAAMDGEPALGELCERLVGYDVFFPRVVGQEMVFQRVEDMGAMRAGRWGIAEPLANAPVCEELDLVICPGIAFTREGVRLGKGKGFYDRYLAKCARMPMLWGVQFAELICDALPHEPHDVRMERVFVA